MPPLALGVPLYEMQSAQCQAAALSWDARPGPGHAAEKSLDGKSDLPSPELFTVGMKRSFSCAAEALTVTLPCTSKSCVTGSCLHHHCACQPSLDTTYYLYSSHPCCSQQLEL